MTLIKHSNFLPNKRKCFFFFLLKVLADFSGEGSAQKRSLYIPEIGRSHPSPPKKIACLPLQCGAVVCHIPPNSQIDLILDVLCRVSS